MSSSSSNGCRRIGESFREDLRRAREVIVSHDGAVLRALTKRVSDRVAFCHLCKEFVLMEDVYRTIVYEFQIETAICETCGWCRCINHGGGAVDFELDDDSNVMDVSMRRCVACPDDHMLCEVCAREEALPCK